VAAVVKKGEGKQEEGGSKRNKEEDGRGWRQRKVMDQGRERRRKNLVCSIPCLQDSIAQTLLAHASRS